MEEIKSRKRLEELLEHERALAYHKAKLVEHQLLLELDRQRHEMSLKVKTSINFWSNL
jgi:serine phosphatase RsbU (regulator of sigma subunit)